MSLTTLLSDAGLGMYTEKFASLGLPLEQVLDQSPAELDSLTQSVNMLKGHAVKFKKSIADIKKGVPDKRAKLTEAPRTPIPPRKEQKPSKPEDNTSAKMLKVEVARTLASLGNLSEFKQSLRSFRDSVMQVDLPSQRRVLEDIEALQKYYRSLDLVGAGELDC
jgi:hypothetical protein